jgi:hypothetical protein
VTLGVQIKYYVTISLISTPIWYDTAVTTFFFLSLGVNTLTTALIVHKIITVYKEIRGFGDSSVRTSTYGTGQRNLYPLISILIESGLITFVGQLAQSIMYKAAPDAFPLVGGCVVMLYVRASCRLLIWRRNFILLYRGFRQQLSLFVSRWELPTTVIRRRRRIQ